jgi:ubiquinone/menaquinone biosynthesis C-methylase UbiE
LQRILEQKAMENIWDQRYGQEEYIYGKVPNAFFKQQTDKLKPGKILLPAEGEGRNAVYAAGKGWHVFALDMSQEGRNKALKLAEEAGVGIQYEICDLTSCPLPENEFDALAIIFAHFPSKTRSLVYRKLVRALKPGGTLILETFSKKQFGKTSGGPQNLDMLNNIEELEYDFKGFDFKEIYEVEVDLQEGDFHAGMAEVIRIVAVKPHT